MFFHESSVDNKNSLYADESSFSTEGITEADFERNYFDYTKSRL